MSEVHNGVSCDRKCQLGLTLTGAFQADDGKGTGIQNRCQGLRARTGYRGENENKQALDRRDGFRVNPQTSAPTHEKVAEDPPSHDHGCVGVTSPQQWAENLPVHPGAK